MTSARISKIAAIESFICNQAGPFIRPDGIGARAYRSRPVPWPLPVFALFRLPPMSLYSISNAQLAFGHVALLDHADFSLEAGERVGLIGRNGAGKSSLLKIIAGQMSPDDGLIA